MKRAVDESLLAGLLPVLFYCRLWYLGCCQVLAVAEQGRIFFSLCIGEGVEAVGSVSSAETR